MQMQHMQKNLSNSIQKQRHPPTNQTNDNKNGTKRQWHTRHRTHPRRQHKHCFISLKKTKKHQTNINPKYKNLKKPLTIRLEMDEMWGRVYCKKTPCWLWHAINHDTKEIIAYAFGSRKSEVLKELWATLNDLELDIVAVFSDDNFAYHEIVPSNILQTGKRNTQRIERKHLTFRTRLKRLARKTICYSKSLDMHKVLFGLLINVLEFGNKLV